ncbi:RIO1 family-domain-containing protein [Truncatella angustata]|uniref:Serine/threonine-protein kinase RIO2 n=1 Tax=Truncatella angustata TaxID=152316 RepID=A0A9P9A1F2_9PEZI|nr:RIO1 family-domain-containing protein [Truncatella angustata]KAH6659461.1 RIO1 family-domain-containing protein [Truncatella angustata]
MKLDTKALRHLTIEDWRVLAAVENGTKTHDLVPTPVIEKLSRLRGGVNHVNRSISALAKTGLISKIKEAKYDGYRLTYGGMDYLALHAYAQQDVVYSVGTRIGVGKESDIMIVADNKGVQKVLKIHRLGRISFRTVKSNRDYLRKSRQGQGGSWMYLSRLAAMKEYAFMKALQDEGFLVPEPISQNRHTILMSLVDAFPLRQISEVGDPAALYSDLIDMILRLAKHGLIHGDFNEFNLLIKEERTPPSSDDPDADETIKVTPVLIDFPQMISVEHANAEEQFDRDVNCIKRFFERKFQFVSTTPGPFFKDAKKTVGSDGAKRLDASVEASGFTKKMLKDLEAAIREQQAQRPEGGEGEYSEPEDDEDDAGEDEQNDHDSGGDEVDASGAYHEEDTASDSRMDFSKLSVKDHT